MVARSVLLLLLLLPASLAAQATDTQVFFDLLRGPAQAQARNNQMTVWMYIKRYKYCRNHKLYLT